MISDLMRAEASVWMLATYRPPLTTLAERLASADPAASLAAAKALAERVKEGDDDPKALATCVPANLFTLPHDTQMAVAELAIAGLPIPIPELPTNLPPELACRFRCSARLASPELLPLDEVFPLDLRAVADAPVERALTSGLFRRMAAHARPAMHDQAITLARAGLSRALLASAEAAEVLLDIARRSSEAVASRALGLLAEPWAVGLPCPSLAAWMKGEEVALAALRLAAARRDVAWVRRFATCEDVARSVRRAALLALGALGEVDDVEVLLALAEEDPAGVGPEAIEALRGLKRRGISPDEDQARRAIELVLHFEALSIEAIAESTSSRADALVGAIDECITRGASKARSVRLLAVFGTRRTITRLVEMAAQSADPILSRCAIRELGRLEERSAEAVLLARLDAEPDACLFALGRLGGAATAQRLRKLLEQAPPPWLSAGLRVLFRLDPSPGVLALAAEHGAISAETLDALQAHGSAEQIDVLAAIARAPGHPFRASAIGALGRTGGPLAIDPLAALLTDGDEEIRELAQAALRALGQRLATPDPPLACLEEAADPGAALVAEAALRRLGLRAESAAETTLLLDAVIGCDHPHLVRVVRPLLRRENPEIRKRSIACLSAAGPACAAWLLPYLSQELPLPVARQALLALGHAAVPGLGGAIAAWLSHPNMNLKKAAAEMLARSRDPDVSPALVEVLAVQDQPGLRELAEKALREIAGPFFRSLLVEKLAATKDPRSEELLASMIAGAFSPEELAALVTSRPDLPRILLLHAYAAHAERCADLDAELRRRGARDRIPRETDVTPESPLRQHLARADAQRMFAELQRHIREAPFLPEPSPELVASLHAAAERAGSLGSRLAVPEQRILSTLLSQLDPATRNDAIALLATTTDPFVSRRVIPFIDIDGEIDPRHAPLLPAAIRQRGPEAARSRSGDPRPAVRAEAALVLRLAGEGILAFTPPSERPALLRAWIDGGHEDHLVAALEGRDALPLAEVAALVAERSGATAAWALAQRWVDERPAERAPALVDIAFLGEIAAQALRELAQGDTRGEVRLRAITELSRRRHADPAFLRPLLADAHPGVREAAAAALLRAGDRDDRAYVLDAWIAGSFRGSFVMTLDEQDTKAIAKAVADATTEAAALHLFGPVASLPLASRIPLLLVLLSSSHPRVAGAARDALRALPTAHLLPHVEARLRAGDLSALDIVGAVGAVPRLLADLARTSEDPATWIRFCLRAAGAGVLYASDLGPSIAAWAASAPSPAALSLLARLADWYDERHARALCHALEPALSGAHRDAVLGALLDALRDQPPELVARVLPGLVRPTDAAALQLLAEAEARSPGLLDLLAPTLRAAVERALDTALDSADPENARRLLTYFAGRAERPSDRERILALLERHVRSSSRRVSLHAHRLLRSLAPRDRYLRATRALLDDPDPTTVRLAIRVLTFGGDVESTAEIADRLFHTNAGVSRAARAGLLVLGETAVPPLLRARSRLRPDRRAAIDAVLDEIRSRLTAGKTAR
ncbi:HEAT repeat domain-containing protein [Polyangium sp. 15x6]|uniref:HEAT repeat domain-containing protein n=1 Tax=Polyangium sp. 15x6 TaxID=3042687 RepID=UPI00249A65E2|nr:HEAT repeat domain-containing protein [Polyangium sp. 15x6]MDI3291874.1 HEAT repeat domain-containing protein [Polyangium sp. 15x6]